MGTTISDMGRNENQNILLGLDVFGNGPFDFEGMVMKKFSKNGELEGLSRWLMGGGGTTDVDATTPFG